MSEQDWIDAVRRCEQVASEESNDHAEGVLWGAARIKELEAQNAHLIEGRRERIATAAMQGMLASDYFSRTEDEQLAKFATSAADALIAELDR